MLMTLVEIGRWVAFIGSAILLATWAWQVYRHLVFGRHEVPPITITTTPPPEERGSK
jgi:hypothetical protein